MRVLAIGLGGVGSALIEPLARYMQYTLEGGELYLVDGDTYDEKNLARQRTTVSDINRNKAEVHAEKLRSLFPKLRISVYPKYINQKNAGDIITEGSIVLSAVDNHKTRKVLQEQCSRLKSIVFISGGNEFHDGNIQVFVKRKGRTLCPPITEFHEEIEYPEDKSPEEMSCEELMESEPQLLFTNLTVACLMLNAFYVCSREKGSPEYREVYFDIVKNAARPAGKGGKS